MSVRLLVALFCCIALSFGEKPKDSNKEQQSSKETVERPNYDQIIGNLQNELNSIKQEEISTLISKQATQLQALDNTQKGLDALGQQFEEKQRNIQTVLDSTDKVVDTISKRVDKAEHVCDSKTQSLTETLNTLSTRMDTLQSAQSTKTEKDRINQLSARIASVENTQTAQQATLNENMKAATSSEDIKDDLDSRIAKLSSSMSREITDNTKRLEMIEEGLTAADTKAVKRSIEALREQLKQSQQRNDATFRTLNERFDYIEQSINQTNTNLKTVYDSTLGAAIDQIISKTLDHLSDFGEYLVNVMDRMKKKIQEIDWMAYVEQCKTWIINTTNTIVNAIQEIDWKGQYILFTEWAYGVYQYIHFWWTEGIQPAIIRQATDLYLGIQRFTKESVVYIHSHVLYKEMMTQSKPYLEMVNIPTEYNGYVLDGVLLMFALSSLVSLQFILGLCCDCCCPRKSPEIPQSRSVNAKKGNKRPSQNKGKKSRK